MTAQPFKHDFKEGNVSDINGAFGYTKALNEVYLHIKEVTNNGQHHLINAIDLLERITVTNEEIMEYTQTVVEELEEQLKREVNASTDNIKDELPK